MYLKVEDNYMTKQEAENDLSLTLNDIDNLNLIVDGLSGFIHHSGGENRSHFRADHMRYQALLAEAKRLQVKIEEKIATL